MWKITNISGNQVKFTCKTSPRTSKGILLPAANFCIVHPQITATMDAQSRRKLISIDKDFNNEIYQLELNKVYHNSELSSDESKLKAEQYINK